ncbi:MAG: hypothetical protein C0490_10865 [Marivirga sp.]|nr:hypothetical protein [Marivirga sp.]
MEITFITASILLLLFAILGLYDGFYLHIFKYRLHEHPESKNEHITHTLRAVLFPAILYFLYLNNTTLGFYIGMVVLFLDVLVMTIDAFMEKDSRAFMGGLPRWEYIVHLFVNGFHFASIAVFILIKVRLTGESISIVNDFSSVNAYPMFIWLVKNLIPGAVLMALLHILVIVPSTAVFWNSLRARITCC